jgi:AraC family transcriptional regulator
MDIHLRQLAPLHVAYVRHVGPYQESCKAWKTLSAWAGPRGLLDGRAMCLGIGHDDPMVTEPSRIRYDACVVVPEGSVAGDGIGIQVVPGGEHAVAIHRGPYERLSEVYGALRRWVADQGRKPGPNPPYEIYRNDARTTPPDELVTEVCFPIT